MVTSFTRSPRPDRVRPQAAGAARSADRRPLVVLLAVILGIGLGGIGYLLLSGPEDTVTVEVSSSPGRLARSTAATLTGGSRTGTTGAAASTPGGAGQAGAASGRNPFGAVGATGATGTGGSGSGGTGSSTAATGATSTGSSGAPAASTVTVTMTAPALYLGLYGWTSDGRPMFRLNSKAVTPAVGGTIAPGVVYKGAVTSKAVKCANVTDSGAITTVCEGEVVALG